MSRFVEIENKLSCEEQHTLKKGDIVVIAGDVYQLGHSPRLGEKLFLRNLGTGNYFDKIFFKGEAVKELKNEFSDDVEHYPRERVKITVEER